MTDDGPFASNQAAIPDPPSLIVRRSNFQWGAALHADELNAGWQNHLTRYVVANARASVAFRGAEPLRLLGVEVLDDPLNLYQITLQAQAVEVQAAYLALRQAFTDEPYDCHLLLETEEGSRFVTIPAPKPPGQVEWKQALKKLWFQLLLAEDARLAVVDGARAAAKSQPLYTFRLSSELDWEEAAVSSSEGEVSAWQRELRLEVDPAEAGVLRARVGWNDSPAFSNPALEIVPLPGPEPASGRDGPTSARQLTRTGSAGRVTRPLPMLPAPGHERHWLGRARLAALLAAVLLLVVVGGIAFGATRGTPSTHNSQIGLSQSPTAGQSPSAIASNTPNPTTAPTAQPIPTKTPRPPTGTAPPPTPVPTPVPTPKPHPTATPSPTPTNAPTATPTPPPTPTPTPTPAPVVVFVVSPTEFVQSCSSSLSSLEVTLDNSGSNVDVSWSISITDTDPDGNVWATADSGGGTVPAGQVGSVTITPISALCSDLAGGTESFTATISWSGGSTTVTDTVTP